MKPAWQMASAAPAHAAAAPDASRGWASLLRRAVAPLRRRIAKAGAQPAIHLQLARWATRRFHGLPEGNRIVCDHGLLWITVDGAPDDIVLSPGEAWAVPPDAAVMVCGLHAAGAAGRVLA